MTQNIAPAGALVELTDALAHVASEILGQPVDPGRIALEAPRQAAHGDLATNAALVLAKQAGIPPREFAERFAAGLTELLGDRLERVEIAGPGFVNLALGESLLRDLLGTVSAAGRGWGGGTAVTPEKLNVEFVSANPTGPMHVGHARNAAFGDSVARTLAFHGHQVDREFYVNDYGSQITKLGESLLARARGEDVAEDGYKGDYVTELAAEIPGAATMTPEELSQEGLTRLLQAAKDSLERFGVKFDLYFSERSLHEGEGNASDRALDRLRESGKLELEDGAWWLRTEALGDDKDRVVIRATGEPTYFASDISYLVDKLDRGYDRLLMVVGADHHGYQGRMFAAMQCIGSDPKRLELLIMQLVHLVENGERARMSKRAGDFVTLDDLVEEIGVDAARWFLLQRSHDTTVELDLGLAKQQSSENPVFYVQYAHARCCSVLEKAAAQSSAYSAEAVAALEIAALRAPIEPAERTLLLALADLPDVVADSAARRAPHRIATYALELAQKFTAFYRDCKIVGAEGDDVQAWRLALTAATRDALATSLDLLGVTAPRRMDRREDDEALAA